MTLDQSVLGAVLDSWDRNNTILVNLLRAMPEVGWSQGDGGQSDRGRAVRTHPLRQTCVRFRGCTEFTESCQRGVGRERDRLALAQMLE